MTPSAQPSRPNEQANFWKVFAAERYHGVSFTASLRTRVTVIGAGYTGLSTALHLAENNMDSVVLEAGEGGAGASGRNAGGLLAKWPDAAAEEIEAKYGKTAGHRLNGMVASSVRLVTRIIDDYATNADLRMSGIHLAAHNRRAVPRLMALATQWSDRSNPISVPEESAIPAALGTERYRMAVRFEQTGTLHPLSFTLGLARAYTGLGGQVLTNSAPTALFKVGDDWIVNTEKGTLSAEYVIVATDGFTNGRLPALDRCFYRLPVAMVCSSPVLEAGSIFGGSSKIPLGDSNSNNPLWFLIDHNSRLIASTLPRRRNRAGDGNPYQSIKKRFRRVYPSLPKLDWDYHWSGHITTTPDRCPRVFELDRRLYAPGGYAGQGLSTAVAVGKEFAKVIASSNAAVSDIPITKPRAVVWPKMISLAVKSIGFPALRLLDRFY